MLAKRWIKNFALIQELRVDFAKGYTVITGETGSGKSILLGALNLILGERADFGLIGPSGDKTFVEAEFFVADLNMEAWFVDNDIDYELQTIVRREINANGRSRAFINDTPVSLQQIRQFTERLININSQHNTIALRDKNFHLELLDILSGIELDVQEFKHRFSKLQEKKKQLDEFRDSLDQAEKDKDYFSFQLEELAELNLANIDYHNLEEELKQIENVEELTTALSTISEGIREDGSVLDQLKSIVNSLNKGSILDSKVGELSSRIQSTLIEMEDIADEASLYLDNLEKDPAKIVELTVRLDAFNRIAQKHKCSNQSELIELQSKWESQVQGAIVGREELAVRQAEIDVLQTELNEKAEELHDIRRKEAPILEKKIISLLNELKMPSTQLKFEINK